ncbi:MAG: NADH-quinone oxidoreductase subunit J [Syntrophus sp. (in: bacteria)]|nr:NADH-quinone oxidoreductase subunit J [Syntrophus sp. (in: bacteria)]
METVIFWILSAFAVVAALAVVFFKRAVNGVMSLLAFMLVMAGLYVLMGAQLVAFFQVIVYVGAVLVLFAFVIMLLNLKDAPDRRFAFPAGVTSAIAAVLLTGMIAFFAWFALQDADFSQAPAVLQPTAEIRQIAVDLFTRHLLVFELASVILFVAAVGAIVISRKEGDPS